MTTIRESGFILKIATGAAIGVTDESLLNPENQSSGSATLGQVPSADGAGGITWSDEIGPVPSGRQILNGTGITGGGDLTADRTLSVVQSALDPANQSSGSASAGQLPTASGGGAIAWQDPPASVNLPGSSTNNALTRWSGTGGDTVKDSNVTLSDAGAMVFGSAGSISKPGTGANSEAFGANAAVSGSNGLAIGPNMTVGTGSFCVAVGYNVTIPDGLSGVASVGASAIASASDAAVFGRNAKVYPVSSGDSTGAIAIGASAAVGNATPGAGCNAAIAIGEGATVNAGSSDSIAAGPGATIGSTSSSVVAIGDGVSVGDNCGFTTAIGGAVSVATGVANSVIVGNALTVSNAAADSSVLIGASSTIDAADQVSIGRSTAANQTGAVAMGRSTTANGLYSIALGWGARINDQDDCVALGPEATVQTVSSGNSDGSICIGHNSEVGDSTPGAGCDAAIAIGENAQVHPGALRGVSIGRTARVYSVDGMAVGPLAKVYDASTGDNDGAVALGLNATIGNVTPGAGCDAAIALGSGATVGVGHSNAVAIGVSAASTASNRVTFASTLEVEVGQGLAVWGVTPPGSQPAKINDPSGGTTVDAEARTAINSILDVLEGAGLSSAT